MPFDLDQAIWYHATLIAEDSATFGRAVESLHYARMENDSTVTDDPADWVATRIMLSNALTQAGVTWEVGPR